METGEFQEEMPTADELVVLPPMTPYQKILRAARRNTGMHLSREEVFQLAHDDAISCVAENDNAEDAEHLKEMQYPERGEVLP